MQHGHVLIKLNFDLLTPHPMVRGGVWVGVCGFDICFHVATFVISLKSDMQYDYVLKKFKFDSLTPPPGSAGGGGVQAKYLPCFCICDSL